MLRTPTLMDVVDSLMHATLLLVLPPPHTHTLTFLHNCLSVVNSTVVYKWLG